MADRLVFVYGTLRSDERVAALLDDYSWDGTAVLEGLHRVTGQYPTLLPGGSVEGRLLKTRQLDRLDEYEGVDRGLYVRVSVPIDDGTAAVYIGDPDRLDVVGEWPGSGPFADRVQRYVEQHDVRIAWR